MIEVRPLTQEDLEIIKADPLDTAVGTYPDFEPGPLAFAAVLDGDLLGAGGIVLFPWRTVGETWIMLRSVIWTLEQNQKNAAVLLMYHKMRHLIKEYGIVRLQTLVRPSFPRAIGLVEAFGFECEGTLRKFAPNGEDMMIYGRLS